MSPRRVRPNPPQAIVSLTDAFPAIDSTGRYHPNLIALRDEGKVSGVYVILDRRTREVLYVGESHTDRLYDTITRHFRKWGIDAHRDEKGRRRGGHTYQRAAVMVAWTITPAAIALDLQHDEIRRLNPRDNVQDGASTIDPGREIPV